jgi:hypothetical protein
MTTLAELVTPLTKEQVEESIYQAIVARGVQTTTWKPGAVTRTIITAVSIVLAAFSALQAMLANSGFLDLATGPWLTLLARYVYGVTRDPGSFATGNLTFDNEGGGTFSGDAGDLIALNSTTGKTYRNTASFSISSMQTGVIIPFAAVELGTDSNATAGQIDALETTLLGVVVTNAAALVGTDEETDESLRTRCREKTGAASPNGPKDAYLYFARSAVRRTDGSSIGITRARAIPDGFGGIDLYLATPTGGVTGTVGDTDTDLGAVDDDLQRLCTPLAVELRTHTAVAETIAVTYEAWIPNTTGKTEAQHLDDVETRLTSFASTMQIGGVVVSPETVGKVYVDALEGEIARALGGVIKLIVTLPVSDTTLATSDAPVIGTVTGVIHFVPMGQT